VGLAIGLEMAADARAGEHYLKEEAQREHGCDLLEAILTSTLGQGLGTHTEQVKPKEAPVAGDAPDSNIGISTFPGDGVGLANEASSRDSEQRQRGSEACGPRQGLQGSRRLIETANAEAYLNGIICIQ
jgi:hypothetical protein